MLVVRLRSWKSFKQKVIEPYLDLPIQRKERFWFRGQGDARWKLKTRLDRIKPFQSDLERQVYGALLLSKFRRELIGLGETQLPQNVALELLARHHGLPTPLLDWTESPYVASYFAFESAPHDKHARVAIYAMDRHQVGSQEQVDFLDDPELLLFNVRAVEQRGVFLRVKTSQCPLEDLLGSGLVKYELPRRANADALRDLEAMRLTARSLFRDFDSAARTAALWMSY